MYNVYILCVTGSYRGKVLCTNIVFGFPHFDPISDLEWDIFNALEKRFKRTTAAYLQVTR